jgi:hypothetical protein
MTAFDPLNKDASVSPTIRQNTLLDILFLFNCLLHSNFSWSCKKLVRDYCLTNLFLYFVIFKVFQNIYSWSKIRDVQWVMFQQRYFNQGSVHAIKSQFLSNLKI